MQIGAIRIVIWVLHPNCNPCFPQNILCWSLARDTHLVKVLCKSDDYFLSFKLHMNRQKDRQTRGNVLDLNSSGPGFKCGYLWYIVPILTFGVELFVYMFRHLELELLTPASYDEKYVYL